MYPTKKVRIETRTVGQSFATVGVVLDDRDGHEIMRGEPVSYGFTGPARENAYKCICEYNANANILLVLEET
jgi:hypothetical protein